MSVRRKRGGGNRQSKQLCWRCSLATGGCPWSAAFRPVKGWTAEKTVIREKVGREIVPVASYKITACPLFREG